MRVGGASSTHAEKRSTGGAHASAATAHDHLWTDLFEDTLRLPVPPTGFWHRAGLSRKGERRLEIGLGVLLYGLATGWIWTLAHPAPGGARASGAVSSAARTVSTLTSALTNSDAPTAAYLTDATLNAIFAGTRGASGKLRLTYDSAIARVNTDSAAPGTDVRFVSGGDVASDSTPRHAGVWSVALAIGNALRPVTDLGVITPTPFSAKSNGRVGLYYLGSWPGERSRTTRAPKKAPPDRYIPPKGFIEVTPQNEDTYVSEHFRLRDFLTHDQQNVWPKYLVLQLRIVDKLELVLADLSAHGVDVSGVRVMSGFRTPQYNAGGGNTHGRAELSRHMYGDASDIFIDSNHDGVMDDLDHDGRITIRDSKVIADAVDRVEDAHPELVGGAGIYPAGPGHGPFIHIDTRGYRARWTGGPGGG